MEPNLILLNPCLKTEQQKTKEGAVAYTCHASQGQGGGHRKIPEACRPASLAESASFRFREKLTLSQKTKMAERQRKTPEV